MSSARGQAVHGRLRFDTGGDLVQSGRGQFITAAGPVDLRKIPPGKVLDVHLQKRVCQAFVKQLEARWSSCFRQGTVPATRLRTRASTCRGMPQLVLIFLINEMLQ